MTIEQQIATVLLTHRQVPEDALSANIRGMCAECRNGPWTAEHVAAEVVAALGITQEWGLRGHDSENVHWKSDDRDDPRLRENEFPFTELVERDVMPWQPDRWRARTSTK